LDTGPAGSAACREAADTSFPREAPAAEKESSRAAANMVLFRFLIVRPLLK